MNLRSAITRGLQRLKWWKEKRKVIKMYPDTVRLTDALLFPAWSKGVKRTSIDRQYLNSMNRAYETGGRHEYSC